MSSSHPRPRASCTRAVMMDTRRCCWYDAVVNDAELSKLVRSAAGDRIVEMAPLMAGDDFSAYLRVSPVCFFFVGAGGRDAFPHHHPRFTIDERALAVGIDTFTRAAVEYLSERP
jgi:metal-dependent amidase/aminoacylase/carboxypeptidase family protein